MWAYFRAKSEQNGNKKDFAINNTSFTSPFQSNMHLHHINPNPDLKWITLFRNHCAPYAEMERNIITYVPCSRMFHLSIYNFKIAIKGE